MKKFFKKGSAELVSLILAVVVFAGLALAVTGTVSKQSKKNIDSGMNQTTTQLGTNYNEASTMRQESDPELEDGVTPDTKVDN